MKLLNNNIGNHNNDLQEQKKRTLEKNTLFEHTRFSFSISRYKMTK